MFEVVVCFRSKYNPFSLSYNASERACLIVTRIASNLDNSIYELYHLPREIDSSNQPDSTDGKRSAGIAAVWVARNRFAVLDKSNTVSCFCDVAVNLQLVIRLLFACLK